MTRNLRKPLMWAAVLAGGCHRLPGPGSDRAQRHGRHEAGHGCAHDGRPSEDDGGHKASQKKLDDLVAAMNQATGDDKVNKLAAVVTEMVARKREMCVRIMSGNMMLPMSTIQPTPEGTVPAGKPEDDRAAHHPKP